MDVRSLKTVGTRGVTIAVITLLLASIATVVLGCAGGDKDADVESGVTAVDESVAPERDTVKLEIRGDVPDVGEGASPLVMRLRGCCANTESELVYAVVGAGGTDVDVVPGKYYLSWVSPVGADGQLYITPAEEKVIIVDEAHNEKRIAEGGASVETETDGRLVWTSVETPGLSPVAEHSPRRAAIVSETLTALEEGLASTGLYDGVAAYETAAKNLGYGGAGIETEPLEGEDGAE